MGDRSPQRGNSEHRDGCQSSDQSLSVDLINRPIRKRRRITVAGDTVRVTPSALDLVLRQFVTPVLNPVSFRKRGRRYTRVLANRSVVTVLFRQYHGVRFHLDWGLTPWAVLQCHLATDPTAAGANFWAAPLRRTVYPNGPGLGNVLDGRASGNTWDNIFDAAGRERTGAALVEIFQEEFIPLWDTLHVSSVVDAELDRSRRHHDPQFYNDGAMWWSHPLWETVLFHIDPADPAPVLSVLKQIEAETGDKRATWLAQYVQDHQPGATTL